MVKFVHIKIGKNLTSEVAYGKSLQQQRVTGFNKHSTVRLGNTVLCLEIFFFY